MHSVFQAKNRSLFCSKLWYFPSFLAQKTFLLRRNKAFRNSILYQFTKEDKILFFNFLTWNALNFQLKRICNIFFFLKGMENILLFLNSFFIYSIQICSIKILHTYHIKCIPVKQYFSSITHISLFTCAYVRCTCTLNLMMLNEFSFSTNSNFNSILLPNCLLLISRHRSHDGSSIYRS